MTARASEKIKQKSTLQTAMTCADGEVCAATQDIMCFLGYQNLIRAAKKSWLLALLTIP